MKFVQRYIELTYILLTTLQTSNVVLRTVTEMQNDVLITSEAVYYLFISLFGNNFTMIRYKFDENTSLSKKMVQNIIKRPL